MILALPVGVAIGLALGMLGAGGSMLTLPALTHLLGQAPHDAATASLVIVSLAAVAGGARQALGGNVCWRHAATFTAAALPAIVLGTAFGDLVSGRVLLGSFGVLMLIAAYAVIRRGPGNGGQRTATRRCPPLRLAAALALGALVGFLTGFLGVGGGFVVVPALVLALGLSMHAAVGTSLAVVTTTGVLGTGVHLASGRTIEWELIAPLGAAMILGAVIGARLGERVGEASLGRAFAALLALVGVYVIGSSVIAGNAVA